jgi:hypothetical protein
MLFVVLLAACAVAVAGVPFKFAAAGDRLIQGERTISGLDLEYSRRVAREWEWTADGWRKRGKGRGR